MAYKAQLVVRARGKEGASIIEKVKELANEHDTTYSEMAVELLGRGLNASDDVGSTFSADDAAKDDAKPAKKESSTTSSSRPKKSASDNPRAPLPPEEAGPPVDPNLPPAKIVKAYIERREERGERAAARILVDFFAEAGPAEGGQVKNLLRREYSDADFEDIMEPVKETEEYRTYTRRALFEEPSPYSELS